MKVRLFFVVLLLVSLEVCGQPYRFKIYRVSEGLPSDVVKAVAQDSLGYFWVATDDGLVKFDGSVFTVYKSALRGQYVKGFLKTKDGRLLVIGDLDLVEIQNKIDTVIFKSVLRGGRNPTDSTLSYPKSIFIDKHNITWLGEPGYIVRYDGKHIKRFYMGNENVSPIFIRSFTFFEDEFENLYATAYNGNIFRFDRLTNSFEPVQEHFPPEVNHVILHHGDLVIACNSGVYTAGIKNRHIVNLVKAPLPMLDVSYIQSTNDSTLLISTFTETLWKVNRKTMQGAPLEFEFDGINTCYVSTEGDIWAATDKGIVLIQENLFEDPDFLSSSHFIEGITQNPEDGSIYYCDKALLVALRPEPHHKWRREPVIQIKSGYFQDLRFGKRGLWAANSFEVILFQHDKIVKKWDFSDRGNFVYDIFIDSHESVWVSQSSGSTVTEITDNFEEKQYPVPINAQSEINLIREGHDGVYAAASSIESYLFFKPWNATRFVNISLPVDFKVEGDFNVQSIAIQKDVVWLATTEGLLRYDHKSIKRIDLGESMSSFSVTSINILDDQNILFANSYGLFRYNVSTDEFWLYDENAGLPSNTITEHGIFVDREGHPWIGTSNGLGHLRQSLLDTRTTLKPYCVNANVNGVNQKYMNGLNVDYGSFISLQFSAITFPENKINMQWNIAELGDKWHTLLNRELKLNDLDAGDYTVQVRAKKNTGEGWSIPSEVRIHVGKPLWQRTEFILYVLLLTILIAWSSYAVSAFVLNKRKEQLQRLVDERTQDLQRTNKELSQRNDELDRFVYSASHDLSAPLKSLLGLISVARLENPDDTQKQYLSMMENSIRKLDGFIQEVVSYSRNTRMLVKFERFNFKSLVHSILQDYQYADNFKFIRFSVDDALPEQMLSDPVRLKIILNNLISNTIKFRREVPNGHSYATISIKIEDNNYLLTVQDNGRGIEPQHLEHIFDMFYRASDKGQGSGLGLYILKEAVGKLNGHVVVDSVFDQGTKFTITLPVPTAV